MDQIRNFLVCKGFEASKNIFKKFEKFGEYGIECTVTEVEFMRGSMKVTFISRYDDGDFMDADDTVWFKPTEEEALSILQDLFD